MKRNLPWCEFPCSPDDLIRAVCFRDVTEIAAEIGVDVDEVGRWRSGHKPVPKLAYLYLAHKASTVLGTQFGPFWGWKLANDGQALICPATGERINYEEVAMMRDYRQARRLATQQAELIERLMTERDFYRENCHRQARFGAMLNRIIDPDEGC